MARYLAKCDTAVMVSLSSTGTRGVNSSLGSRPWGANCYTPCKIFPAFFTMAITSNAIGFTVLLIFRLCDVNRGSIVQV